MMPDRFELRALLAEAVELNLFGSFRYENVDPTFFSGKAQGFSMVRDGIRLQSSDKPVIATIEIARDPSDENSGFFSVWVNSGDVSEGPWAPHIEKLIDGLKEEIATARSIKVAKEIEDAQERKRIEERNLAAMWEKWASKPVPGKK